MANDPKMKGPGDARPVSGIKPVPGIRPEVDFTAFFKDSGAMNAAQQHLRPQGNIRPVDDWRTVLRSHGVPAVTMSDCKPRYQHPLPNQDWKGFLLDANKSHIDRFVAYSEKNRSQGKKTLSPQELYAFCLTVSADCENEMAIRLAGRNAKERVLDYLEETAKLMEKHDMLQISLIGDETEHIKSLGTREPTGRYTHRMYLNPRLGAMPQFVELLLDMQKHAGISSVIDNPFRFKFISPNAMLGADGNVDCTNFIRPDRVKITFHQSDFRQIKDLIFMMTCMGGGRESALFEQRPAFTIPYVYDNGGNKQVMAFGIHSPGLRYGRVIANALSEAYSALAATGMINFENARKELEKALPESIGKPILDLLHFLYTQDQMKSALSYLQTETPGRE